MAKKQKILPRECKSERLGRETHLWERRGGENWRRTENLALPFPHLSHRNIPLQLCCAHHLPKSLGEAPPGRSAAGSRVSVQLSRIERLDWGTRQALRVRWCRRVRPALFGLRGHRDHSGCPGCQTNEDCHLGRRDVIQGQRSKAEPSFLLGPPTAPSLPRLGKGHTHKNFRHTVNIFAFPPTFPMGYQLQNS